MESRLIEKRSLRGKHAVFEDRAEAGRVLAEMLRETPVEPATILAIPAGGVPVATAIARALGWPLDLAVVSKVTLPWNREAGYGAVAFDGTVLLNDELVQRCGLSASEVADGIAATQRKVLRRAERLRRRRPALALAASAVLLVDDGLASGFTLRAAIAACRNAGAASVAAAVPTAHARAVERVLPDLDCLICANVREETPFAVADAYVHWQDVPEAQAELELERLARDVSIHRVRR